MMAPAGVELEMLVSEQCQISLNVVALTQLWKYRLCRVR